MSDEAANAYNFYDAVEEAKVARKAMKGFGTDDDTLTTVLAKCTSANRQELTKAYRDAFDRDLMKDVKSETSGHYGKLCGKLLKLPALYDAETLRKAMKGVGTDERKLTEIVSQRTPAELQAIKVQYTQLFERDLEEDIKSEASGTYRKIMLSLFNRMDNIALGDVDMKRAKLDATRLLEAGEKKIMGVDEDTWVEVLCSQPAMHVHFVCVEYAKMSKYDDVWQAIDAQFHRSWECTKHALKAVAYSCRNPKDGGPANFFAHELKHCMSGLGTCDSGLIRIVVTRSDKDLHKICNAYEALFEEPLSKAISNEASGNYENLLLKLCGEWRGRM